MTWLAKLLVSSPTTGTTPTRPWQEFLVAWHIQDIPRLTQVRPAPRTDQRGPRARLSRHRSGSGVSRRPPVAPYASTCTNRSCLGARSRDRTGSSASSARFSGSRRSRKAERSTFGPGPPDSRRTAHPTRASAAVSSCTPNRRMEIQSASRSGPMRSPANQLRSAASMSRCP